MTPSSEISRLLEIMRGLRDPDTGCPWDVKQDFASIAPYAVEEAYEVVDAIERGAMTDLRDELGDLLLQVVFHSQMATEIGAFTFEDVVFAITSKMIRRHPHVFGDRTGVDDAGAKLSWNEMKARERASRASESPAGSEVAWAPSLLGDVPSGLPALTGAVKLQERAAEVGFDWREAAPILDKIEEELAEFRQALQAGDNAGSREELGDLLFSVVNIARHLRIDPEAALRSTNNKFRRRFAFVEGGLARQGSRPGEASLREMEELWRQAKVEEKV